MILLPHVETNITLACQNRCVACNHFIPMQKPSFVSVEQVRRDVNAFANVAHVAKYALIGGEPLLHKGLVEIAAAVRASGIADEIELWTNGILLEKQPQAVWDAVDTVMLTMYPGKLDSGLVERLQVQHGGKLVVKDGPAYFTRIVNRETATDAQAAALSRGCWYARNTHVLDNGHFYRCCMAPFIPSLLMGLPEAVDGLPLEGITEEKLMNYLTGGALQSCYRCAGHGARHIDWHETSRENWLEESLK